MSSAGWAGLDPVCKINPVCTAGSGDTAVLGLRKPFPYRCIKSLLYPATQKQALIPLHRASPVEANPASWGLGNLAAGEWWWCTLPLLPYCHISRPMRRWTRRLNYKAPLAEGWAPRYRGLCFNGKLPHPVMGIILLYNIILGPVISFAYAVPLKVMMACHRGFDL